MDDDRASAPRTTATPHASTGRGCACGGGCPTCAGALARGAGPGAGPASLGGRGKPSAPSEAGPGPLREHFGRWASYKTVFGPVFNPQGANPFFRWSVNLDTSIEYGYIVQKVESTWFAENCDGTPFTGVDNNVTYWERWSVYEGKITTPKDSLTGADDRWERNVCAEPAFGTPLCPIYPMPTWGVWATAGELYAYPDTDLSGFSSTSTGRSPAGTLDHSLVEPPQDLGRPTAARVIAGAWDACDPANSTHHQIS